MLLHHATERSRNGLGIVHVESEGSEPPLLELLHRFGAPSRRVRDVPEAVKLTRQRPADSGRATRDDDDLIL